MRRTQLLFPLLALAGLLWGCQPVATQPLVQAQIETGGETAVPPPVHPPTRSPAHPPPAAPTHIPTTTASPTPPPTAPPTATPTATPIGPCDQRIPPDDLLTFVTLEYGLSRDYAPGDLTPLAGHLPVEATLGYPTEVRQIIIEPLMEMIDDMRAVGLRPFIISGYRSYNTQAIAWTKWNETHPDSAAIVSSPPGHSEHQLGTTLDFGSPELPDILGEEDIQFHTYFYKTSEGIWLRENAHRYGFTLSYPREGFEATGFYYEPWHYRYVGVELATQLHESGSFLAQYLLDTQPLPCIP
ncbi:MAG: M15 family metallopeptidase [Chloroflexi bacterium]|nr:M15 family metallopeptidase [Chloroflexota bacterium]